jgi:hypothetical protein
LCGAVGTRGCAVVSVARVAITAKFSINLCATLLGVFVLFKQDDTRTFGDDKTASDLVER